jgi:hypothetical protein
MIRRWIGRVVVDNVPLQPFNIENVKKYLVEVIDLPEQFNYSLWVGGSTAYDLVNAEDLDLYLTGEIHNINDLENLMHDMYEIAFRNYGLRLDLRWCSNLESIIDWDGQPISADVKFIQIKSGGHINTDENINKSHSVSKKPNVTQISEWLIQGTWDTEKPSLSKSKQWEYWNKHKKFPKISAREFIKSLS